MIDPEIFESIHLSRMDSLITRAYLLSQGTAGCTEKATLDSGSPEQVWAWSRGLILPLAVKAFINAGSLNFADDLGRDPSTRDAHPCCITFRARFPASAHRVK